jgi:hypothetical protein
MATTTDIFRKACCLGKIDELMTVLNSYYIDKYTIIQSCEIACANGHIQIVEH